MCLCVRRLLRITPPPSGAHITLRMALTHSSMSLWEVAISRKDSWFIPVRSFSPVPPENTTAITLADLNQQDKMTNTFEKHCFIYVQSHTEQISLLKITLLWQQPPSSTRNVFNNLISTITPVKYKEIAMQLCLSFLWLYTAWYHLVWHFRLFQFNFDYT